ncbi:MAG: autotransporter outer membrane beta-barrel domain-containing protein [Pseudomonadota bacterium]
MKLMAILRQIALLMALVAFAAGSLPSTASAQTSCSNTPLTNDFVDTRLVPDLASGLCQIVDSFVVDDDEQLSIAVFARSHSFGLFAGRAVFAPKIGDVIVSDSSFDIDGIPATFAANPAVSDVLDVGAHTAIGTVTLGGTFYTITMQFTTTEDEVTVESVVITGGAFGGDAAAASVDVATRQSSANKSAGAAFGRASNDTQKFVTQTQTQNRLLDERAGSDNDGGTGTSVGLAEAYGKTIRRPRQSAGQTAWHSKDLLNHYRSQHASERREKEQRAIVGLQQLGVNPTAEIVQPTTGRSKWDFWAAGGLTRVDSSRTGNSFDGDLIFARSGFDYLVTNSFLVGAFGGYDKADAEFASLLIDVDSRAKIAGGYFGYKMTRAMTGLPVDLVLDGQGSYAWIDYDVHDNSALTDGDFDGKRFAGSTLRLPRCPSDCKNTAVRLMLPANRLPSKSPSVSALLS